MDINDNTNLFENVIKYSYVADMKDDIWIIHLLRSVANMIVNDE